MNIVDSLTVPQATATATYSIVKSTRSIFTKHLLHLLLIELSSLANNTTLNHFHFVNTINALNRLMETMAGINNCPAQTKRLLKSIQRYRPTNGEIWQHESTSIVALRGVYQGSINKQKYIHFNGITECRERESRSNQRQHSVHSPLYLLFVIHSTLKALIIATRYTLSDQSAPAAGTCTTYRTQFYS